MRNHVAIFLSLCVSTFGAIACGGASPATTSHAAAPDVDAGEGTSSSDGGKDAGHGGADAGGGGSREGGATETDGGHAGGGDRIQTVFLIMMENRSWSSIKGDTDAPYINSLLSMGGHAEQYSSPPGNHPSELNYIWLEAGSALGITTDDPPADNHQSTSNHLVTLLDQAGVSWKAYAEDISGTGCPLEAQGTFVPRHTPMLFFDDVTNTNDPNSSNCATHVRPYTELADDLANGKVARYNFITPNLCDDMHGLTFSCGTTNFSEIAAGDTWLKAEVPKILQSDAYKNNGVLFILWDEGDESILPGTTASDGPIPLIVLSPKAKPNYTSQTQLTHSSMLRTVQEIFGVTPFLGDAASATDLSEFFTSFP